MIRGAITSNIDVAQVVLYALLHFLRRPCFLSAPRGSQRRLPLDPEVGPQRDRGFLLIPTPKTFLRGDGKEFQAPNFEADMRKPNATKVAVWPGAPLTPNGDPMLAGVGPGAYAMRVDTPEKMHDGRDLIAPLRVATNFAVSSEDQNPIGMEVVAADRGVVGVIKDIWVDRAKALSAFTGRVERRGGRRPSCQRPSQNVDGSQRRVQVDAILSDQFANVPRTRNPDQVTLLEEDKIAAYYAAGTLYATPARVEPLL